MLKVIYKSKSRDDTISLGKLVSKHLFKGSIITLCGDLGAGKTTFTKGIGEGLSIKEEINSPTFNIVKCYDNKLPLFHIDAYRLEDVPSENKNIGLEELIDGPGVAIIEWPKFIEEFIDYKDALNIEITINKDDNSRNFVIYSENKKYEKLFEEIENGK